jgi:hypothetical protein
MTNTQDVLSSYASGWSRNGPIARSGDVIQYRGVPGPRLGQTIWLNDVGAPPERPDWQYRIYENGKELCCNRHFKSAEDALVAASAWDAAERRLVLRPFVRGVRDEAITVDGLTSEVEVTIDEIGPDDWRFQVIKDGMGWGQWNGPWLNPSDALAAYRASAK